MRILIVEDDPFFQKFYTTKVAEAGYDVALAINGKEGLEKMVSWKPNMVLLDLIMPVLDGFEVLKRRQVDPILKAIPVLIFSTLGQDEERTEAKNLGANGYVHKGMTDFTQTVQVIRQVLGQ
ncbi:MAG: response regulator [Nitrospirae bacterium]|nr:MAG: response regulator [Nitrospirota bacterium]